MSNYLRRYVGKYRVKSDYDLDTADWVKDPNGEIDDDFDGQYIDCKNNIKIRHVLKTSKLACHIPSKARGVNILRQIYMDKINNNLIQETNETKKYSENLTEALSSILENISVLDFDVYFEFKNTMLDYIAELVGARTSGAKISPFSIKNLPKEPYIISKEDEDKYKDSISHLEMAQINQANRQFILEYNIEKNKKLKPKQQIHKAGLWNEYCDFLKGWK